MAQVYNTYKSHYKVCQGVLGTSIPDLGPGSANRSSKEGAGLHGCSELISIVPAAQRLVATCNHAAQFERHFIQLIMSGTDPPALGYHNACQYLGLVHHLTSIVQLCVPRTHADLLQSMPSTRYLNKYPSHVLNQTTICAKTSSSTCLQQESDPGIANTIFCLALFLRMRWYAPCIIRSAAEDELMLQEFECMRINFEPLLYKYGVDLAMYGHVHAVSLACPCSSSCTCAAGACRTEVITSGQFAIPNHAAGLTVLTERVT